MLLENGGEVGLGHVIGKRAVAEYNARLARRGQLLVPFGDAERHRLYVSGSYIRGETDDQRSRADAMYRFSGDCLLLDRNGEVESELEQQFEEDVLLCAVGLQVLDGLFERLG